MPKLQKREIIDQTIIPSSDPSRNYHLIYQPVSWDGGKTFKNVIQPEIIRWNSNMKYMPHIITEPDENGVSDLTRFIDGLNAFKKKHNIP